MAAVAGTVSGQVRVAPPIDVVSPMSFTEVSVEAPFTVELNVRNRSDTPLRVAFVELVNGRGASCTGTPFEL